MTCSRCGCEGIHACIGHKPVPMTEEEKKNLEKAMTRILRVLNDGEPCGHPGCLSHVSHPCEGCGRVGGVRGD